MKHSFCIWSPVIIAQLHNPRRLQDQIGYPVNEIYKSIEDLKIKVKHWEVKIQGKMVKATIKLDIIFLVEDTTGKMHLISREETITERISLQEFTQSIDKEQPNKFIIDIINIARESEIKGYQLLATYFIDFIIMVIRDQVVRLSPLEQEQIQVQASPEPVVDLRPERFSIDDEKEELRRKIFYYEKDILSLKRGIRKIESHNAVLTRENNRYQQLVEQLQSAIREKDLQLNRYDTQLSYWNDQNDSTPDNRWNLSNKIKRMFLSN